MNTPELNLFFPDEIDVVEACPKELIVDENHEMKRILIFCRVLTINCLWGIYVFDFCSPDLLNI